MLSEVTQALELLKEMRQKHEFVSHKTGALHQACEQLMEDQVSHATVPVWLYQVRVYSPTYCCLIPILLRSCLVPILLSSCLIPILSSSCLIPILLSSCLIPILLSSCLIPIYTMDCWIAMELNSLMVLCAGGKGKVATGVY